MAVSQKTAVQRLRVLLQAGVEEIPRSVADRLLQELKAAEPREQWAASPTSGGTSRVDFPVGTYQPPLVTSPPSAVSRSSFETPVFTPPAFSSSRPVTPSAPPVQPVPRKPAIQPVLPLATESEDFSDLIAMEDRVEALRQLGARVARCTKCLPLVGNRTQTVLGDGNPYASLMFIGEAPGADEDRQGVPFVGRAGKLLTDMIEKGMKLSRPNDVYICNILRCRPPANRAPLPIEAATCRPFLDTQIAIVKPKFICCMGASAAQYLLNTTTTISRMRLREFTYAGATVVCTYHPAYLLRNPSQKAAAWADLQFLMKLMSGE